MAQAPDADEARVLALGGTTFPQLLLEHAAARPDGPALREKIYGIWQTTTWRELADQVEAIAAGLAELGTTRRQTGGPWVFPDGFAAAPLQLLRNNGNGTFSDITKSARLEARGHVIAIVPTDFDNHRDLDLAIHRLAAGPLIDELALKRLKKRKLLLKDQIVMIQRQLDPDVPA